MARLAPAAAAAQQACAADPRCATRTRSHIAAAARHCGARVWQIGCGGALASTMPACRAPQHKMSLLRPTQPLRCAGTPGAQQARPYILQAALPVDMSCPLAGTRAAPPERAASGTGPSRAL
eukprot:12724952-Alexandrium_andersonii.AAC.2